MGEINVLFGSSGLVLYNDQPSDIDFLLSSSQLSLMNENPVKDLFIFDIPCSNSETEFY